MFLVKTDTADTFKIPQSLRSPTPHQIQQEHPLQGVPPMLINKSDSLTLAFVDHVSASCVMVAYIK